jgi:hypothetical protein
MASGTHGAEFELRCVVGQSFSLDVSGQLRAAGQFVKAAFRVSRETGKFSNPSWPFFASPSSRQQILHTGDRGEPFVVLSTNRTAQGGINVELLSVETFRAGARKPFVAIGDGGNVYSGTCE